MELEADKLARRADLAELGFESTAELEPLDEPIAQSRAREALEFSVEMDFAGYNLYALGAVQTDKRAIVLEQLQAYARERNPAQDWCYVENFEDPSRPIGLSFPPGGGRRFRHHMQAFVADLLSVLPAAFSSEEFQAQTQALANAFQQTQDEDAAALEREARQLGLTMLTTPNGFVFAPVAEGKVMEQEAFLALGEDERKAIQEAISHMTDRLVEQLRDYPQKQQELAAQGRTLRRETAQKVLAHLLARTRTLYQDNAEIIGYLERCEIEVLENLDKVLAAAGKGEPRVSLFPQPPAGEFLDRFSVNLIIDHATTTGAPVLYESNPSLENLIGKLEHHMEYGNPVTDFSHIRPGALHRANGGYLLLDAERVLTKPFAWEALKRALSDGCIRIETVSQLLNLTYSVSLEPEPIPLDIKVVLLGSRYIYHVLREYDADFAEHFKVVADFADHTDWNADNSRAYARKLAKMSRDIPTLPLHADAVGRVLEHCSRQVEDRERLSTHMTEIKDLLQEGDFYARQAGEALVRRSHISAAIDRRIYRLDRFRELVRENISRGLIRIETAGSRIGQVNGLSVVSIGDARFGQPSRITATARLGRGEFIDIEREAELGGKLHSKAVMIVSSYLASTFAREHPLALHASLVFEQSYGGIEGDSASMAEVCALMSAIIERPIKQSLAITGSMDQHGNAQAVGGVNEKIEGFFEICCEQGLTGDQGVILPVSNQLHLMLRDDVVDAVAAGRFHIYAVSSVEEAAALLLAPEGQITTDAQEIKSAVQARLEALHAMARHFQSDRDENGV